MNNTIKKERYIFLSLDALGDLTLRQPILSGLLDTGSSVCIVIRPLCIELIPTLDERLSYISSDIDPYISTSLDSIFKDMNSLLAEILEWKPTAIVCPLYNRTFLDEWLLLNLPEINRYGFLSDNNQQSELEKNFPELCLNLPLNHNELFTDYLSVEKEMHECDKFNLLFNKIVGFDQKLPYPDLHLPKSFSQGAYETEKSSYIKEGNYAIVSAAAKNTHLKVITDEQAQVLINYLFYKYGLKSVLIGIQQEQVDLDRIAAEANKKEIIASVWIGKPGSLIQLLKLIEGASIYTGCDSGPMHFAAALRIPVLAIFGGGTFPRFLPRSDHSVVLTQYLPCFHCDWNCLFDRSFCIEMVKKIDLENSLDTILTNPSESIIHLGDSNIEDSNNFLNKFALPALRNIRNLYNEKNDLVAHQLQIIKENQTLYLKEYHEKQIEIDRLRIENESKVNQINMIYSSFAWKIGRLITRGIKGILFFIPNSGNKFKQIIYNFKLFIKHLHFSLIYKKIQALIPSLRKHKMGKFNFSDQLKVGYGVHRSGWSYALSNLKDLHNKDGVLFDAFIERTFCWHPNGVKPHLQPWVGVIHVPPKVPIWFQHEQSNESIFSSQAWKDSIKYCKGLYTLSYYHKKNLDDKFDFPICNLIHPTEIPDRKWSWELFEKNKKKQIVQIGWWLRKLHSIYLLPTTKYSKIFLRKEDADLNEIMRLEKENMGNKEALTNEAMNSVSAISFMPNKKYDILLSENIVFIDVYDSSANNAIIECMARNTPILVNRIEPVIEYLGEEYPLLYDTLEEAAKKADDFNLIREAHIFLVNHPMKSKLTGDYFRESIIASEIYQNL